MDAGARVKYSYSLYIPSFHEHEDTATDRSNPTLKGEKKCWQHQHRENRERSTLFLFYLLKRPILGKVSFNENQHITEYLISFLLLLGMLIIQDNILKYTV